MKAPHSDALVFFGASGDLAYKQIFPALQELVKRGSLDVPIVGVAFSAVDRRATARQRQGKHRGTRRRRSRSIRQAVVTAPLCRR